jgi:hypothetical protein
LVRSFKQLAVFVEQHLARIVHRNHAQLRALGGGELLPRHDVGVVLEVRDDDLVALAHVLPAPALGHEVDGLGGAAHEDHLFDFGRVDELANALPCAFVRIGRTRSKLMRRAMNVRVLVRVEVRDAIDDRLRLVRGGCVVEPHELLAVHALLQDREVAAHGVDVERRMLAAAGERHRVRAAWVRLGRRDEAVGQAHRIDEVELRIATCRCRRRARRQLRVEQSVPPSPCEWIMNREAIAGTAVGCP